MPAKYLMDEYNVIVIYDRPVSDKGGAEFEPSILYDEGEAFADARKYVGAGKCDSAKVYRYNGTAREYLLAKSTSRLLDKCTLIGEVNRRGTTLYDRRGKVVTEYDDMYEGEGVLTYGEFLNESMQLPEIEFECTCADITEGEWDRLMKGKRKYPYRKIVEAIRQTYPEMYEQLGLMYSNPWSDDTYRTSTHIIMMHSATEYFFRVIRW